MVDRQHIRRVLNSQSKTGSDVATEATASAFGTPRGSPATAGAAGGVVDRSQRDSRVGRGMLVTDVTAMGVVSLAERLAGEGKFAIVTSSALSVLGLSGVGANSDDDLGVLEVSLDVLLGDTAGLERILEDPIIERAQLVLLVVPFGRSRGRPSRYDISEMAARNVASVLAPGKLFGCALLPRSISGRRRGPLLGEIAAGRHVSTVIDLPARELYGQVPPAFRVCVVVFEDSQPPRSVFISVPLRADAEIVLGEYETLVSRGGRTAHGFALDQQIDFMLGILPEQLDPERERRIEEASAIGELRRLGDLYEIGSRSNPAVKPRHQPDAGDVPLLTARMIRNSRVMADDVDRWIESSAGPALQAGDVVIRAIERPGSLIQAAEVYEDDLPMIASHSVLVLKTGSQLPPTERRLLVHFIGSRRFAEQFVSDQQSHMRILARDLADVRVPVPDSDLLNAFEAVESAAADFEQWRDEAAALLESSLDSDDLQKARHELVGSSNLLRQRADAARLLDDLDHRVATRYPLPIAYRWRVAVAERESSEAMSSVLGAYEVLLAYLAIMALTAASTAGVEIGYVKNIRHQFTRGITLGNWKGIMEEVARAKAYRRRSISHPFREVYGFLRDPKVCRASDRLYSLRNDIAHLRTFGPVKSSDALDKAWSDLRTLFLAAEFTTEYPLIRVLETRWDTFEQHNTITYRHLQGAHPIVPREVRSVQSSTVEADSLYLIDSSDQLHLLRPYMIGVDCRECGQWSTLHPDRRLSDERIEYKSFEHGHPNVMGRLEGRALADVGILNLDTP